MPKNIDNEVWGEVPSNTTPRTERKKSFKNKIDKKWFFAGVFIIIVLIAAVTINTDRSNNISISSNLLDIDNGDLKIDWGRYATTDIELLDSLTITNSGVYHLTGSLDNGSILINAGDTSEVKLILDDVSIKNSTSPAISCISGDDLVIELIGENYLADGTKYSADLDEDIKSTIYSKADLTFEGDGELTVAANYQDGIVGKDDLKFSSGTYHIAATDDGIRGKDSVYITGGTFDITAKGDAVKSTNETDAGKGFVLIENGNIAIAAGDDGIHAVNMLAVQGGTINITKSYEGLEAQKIIINNGEISVTASDDGINAGGGSDNTSKDPMAGDANCELTFNGGNVYINASGDGVDSNGYIYFNDGKVVIDGPTNNGNGALDSGLGIIMDGGEVIAAGSSGMAETLGDTSSIYNISVYFPTQQTADTKIEIRNSNDETILAHTSAKAFSHLAAGSAYFKPGETYALYLNGEKYQDFIISDIVTTIGNSNSNNMMMPPGGRRK